MGARTLRYEQLGALFAYPTADYVAALNRCLLALDNTEGDAGRILRPLRERVESMTPAEVEEMYTRTFDINPVCTLEVGWHVYGEDYARGAFLVKMREMLREHSLPESSELPDHLTHVVVLLGRLQGEEADHLVSRYLLPALQKMLDGMKEGEQPYKALLKTVWAVLRHDHDVELVPPRAKRGDPPDWNRRLPMLGGQNPQGGPGAGRGKRGGHDVR